MIPALDLAPGVYPALAAICFVAGMVRGFAGFALSAVAMAVAVLFLPPIELIPMLWWQEMSASVLMIRGGWKDADRRVAIGLVIGSAVGLPVGLTLTGLLDVEVSKLVALALIVTLAATQLARLRLAFLATRPGLLGSGLLAGVASGLANVGGMVVALYVLARQAPARQMRASLVMYLFVSSLITFCTLTLFGVMDWTAVARGWALAPATGLGVVLGKALFRPAWEPCYKPFCLWLLIALAVVSLIRLGVV